MILCRSRVKAWIANKETLVSTRLTEQHWLSIFRNVSRKWHPSDDALMWDEVIVGTLKRVYLQPPLDAVEAGLQDILARIDAYDPPGSRAVRTSYNNDFGPSEFIRQRAAQFANPPHGYSATVMRALVPADVQPRVTTPPGASSGLLSYLWNNLTSPTPSPAVPPAQHVVRPVPPRRAMVNLSGLGVGTWDEPLAGLLQAIADRPAWTVRSAAACMKALRNTLRLIGQHRMVGRGRTNNWTLGRGTLEDLGNLADPLHETIKNPTDRALAASSRGEAHRMLSEAAWGQVCDLRRAGREHLRGQLIPIATTACRGP